MRDRKQGRRRARPADPLVTWLQSPRAPERVSLGAALEAMGGMGFGRLLLILTLPNVLVVPSVPPFPFLCGLPAMVLCTQMALGRQRAALPRWAERLSLGRSAALRVARFAAALGRLARPGRWNWTRGRAARAALGTLLLLLTIVVCLPLLGLNLLPAVGLAVLCLGLAEEDGVLAAVGALLSMAGLGAMFAVVHLALLAVSGDPGIEASEGMVAIGEGLLGLLH